jgi:hypothetical protein
MPDTLLPGGPGTPNGQPAQPLSAPIQRRLFMQYTGAAAGAAALALAGCEDKPKTEPAPTTVEVGDGDLGVLNLAYALEQLEAAFYVAVREGSYYTNLAAGSAEKQVFDDLYLHEKIHVDFFKSSIASGAIKTLEADFSTIDFGVRLSQPGAAKLGVLNAARQFEDLGVAAYNGAARFITTPGTLAMAGKIVSVEARHAALIRDLIDYNTFVGADVVTPFVPAASGVPGDGTGTGLELSKTPAQVVAAVNPYLKEGSKLTAAALV